MKLTVEEVKALKRKRGELDLSTPQLAHKIGISPWTLYRLFKNDDVAMHISTVEKIKTWLIFQYSQEERNEELNKISSIQRT